MIDTSAMNQLSYGVFVLSTKWGDITNGCITNTCMMVALQPKRIVISVQNSNYTCELIKESGVFTVSVLDETCSFETIKHFGFQSGRTVRKFESMQTPTNQDGIPYLGWQCCAMISGKVLQKHDLGTHTMFIAEVTEATLLNDRRPLTYADYHSKVKPQPEKKQPQEEKKIVAWRCKICNYVLESPVLPPEYICPLCGHGADDFEPVYGD